jgi:hypothetical protein
MTMKSGNVGIGMTAPTAKLHVIGDTRIEGNTRIQGDAIITGNWEVQGTTTYMNTYTSVTSNVHINNVSGSGPALRVTQSGVGANYPIADFYDNDVSTTVPALRIADGGNVGIGTGVPQQKLHVQGDMRVGEFTGYVDKLVPAVSGRINGVNITALNTRTRTSGAAAVDCVSTWTARTSASDNSWLSVCWAPELSIFVAVAASGAGNRVMTSPDGITWTARTSAADNNWWDVCWAPELSIFVAVATTGTDNRVMTSPNGISWTTQTSPAENSWISVCWAPELSIFVAVANSGIGTGNRVMTSPNGITWTTRTSAADNGWFSVCWAPELSIFVAVATSGAGNRVMTSPDGITWTARTSAANNTWRGVCWSPELSIFVAVALSGESNRVMTSPDGITWTSRTSAANNYWVNVCWAPELSIFVAVAEQGTGDRVMTSPNGITWTTQTTNDNQWHGICWAPELSIFAAVAWSGSGNRVMTSAIGMPNAKSVVKALPSQMMVSASGNVGIGTTNPMNKLHVSNRSGIRIDDGSSNIFLLRQINNTIFGGEYSHITPFNATTNTVQQLVIDGAPVLINPLAGNVGIGTTNPQATLHVTGNILTSGTITGNMNYSIYYKNIPAQPATVYTKNIAGSEILSFNQIYKQGVRITKSTDTQFTLAPGVYHILLDVSMQSQGAFETHYGIDLTFISGSGNSIKSASVAVCLASQLTGKSVFSYHAILNTQSVLSFTVVPNGYGSNQIREYGYATNPIHTVSFVYLGA